MVLSQLLPGEQAQSQHHLPAVHLPLLEPRCLLMAVPNGDVEVGVAAAPVGDLGEREGPQALRREKEQRVEPSCAVELLWEADAFPLQALGGTSWWDNQGSPGGRQVYGARNWKSESLQELKLWSQMRWSSRVGGGRQEDTDLGNTVCVGWVGKKPREVPERETKGDMRKTRKVGTWSQGEDGGHCPLRQQPQLYPPVSVVGLVSWPPW
ncbi:hypothetical protein J1605_001448 [Eschrichtius robustus]|uniref:Uncharacterized protein n=1 Tax=Eschrichtius robustus TaxID=9764 RepID=A0AB34I0V0_ESCRO|nr:hypothetical protein J1605_001448 [Eschrichtius robustus]